MGNCWCRWESSDYRVSSNVKSEQNQVTKQRNDYDSKLPSNPEEVEDLRRDSAANPLIVFSYDELKTITANFRPDRVLGGGGFGSVYKGFISEELRQGLPTLAVAVKVHDGDNSHQGHREWLAEVIFLGQLSHPNLVKLVGYCCEDQHRVLIYEYMSRGSVEHNLFSKILLPLPWSIRMKIAFGAAKGLAFLHEPACKYVVWISYSGLGNRILTLASAFLYALLTNRVLLVDPGVDMVDLFCEPFPHVSWFLPPDFPLNSHFSKYDQKSDQCYGKMLKNKATTESMVPSFVYLHLAHDYDDQDKLFFCDEDQTFLQKVPWLVVRTDNYFVPSLFLMPSFEQQLSDLFPNKETIFHFLGRYLFHPTNKVWGLVSRYYHAYLANADERIGIQIRVFDTGTGPFQHVLDQILACTLKENLLPDVNPKGDIVNSSGKPKSKAVLMTSLSSGYFEKVRDMYWEHPTATGEVIGIYQPSHEGYQQTEKKMHNQKAWAEMYLLSLTDALVTSSWSTFGYVAQGLGGLKPWILYKPENGTAPDPACQRAMSMEPCFHAPPFYDCKAKRGTDTGALVPHVRHCEDMSWGLKLVDRYS